MRKSFLFALSYIILFKLSFVNSFDGFFSPSRNAEVKSKRCTYMRTHGMLAVDCYALGLTNIPSVLRSNIEVYTHGNVFPENLFTTY